MFAILSAEINLMPDWTFFIQLVIFFAAMAVLYLFVFKPVLKVIEYRNKFTLVRKNDAGELESFADGEEAKRKEIITLNLKEAENVRANKIADARRKAEEIILSARAESKKLFDSTEMSVEISEERVAEDMQRSSCELAKDIIDKIYSK